MLNDDIESAVTAPTVYSSQHKKEEEGMYSLYVRYADDGKNVRFFINPKVSVLNSDKMYFEADFSTFAKLMKLADENTLERRLLVRKRLIIIEMDYKNDS